MINNKGLKMILIEDLEKKFKNMMIKYIIVLN